jgi:K+-sensing histidine kinase KdpD
MNLQRLREAVRSAGREGLPPASARAYLFALACIGLAVLAHFAFAQLSADISPSILYNPAVFVAALVGGTHAGALAAGASALLMWWTFDARYLGWRVSTLTPVLNCALYVATTVRYASRGGEIEQPALLRWATPVLVACAALLLTTLVLLAVDSYLAPDHLVLGYLLPTVVIAMHYGSTLAVISSFAGEIAATYFLFPPKLSFFIAAPLHVGELGFFLLLAIIASKAVAALTDDVRARRTSHV